MAKPKQIHSVSASPRIRLLVYGNSGAGKTRFVGSCGERTLIIRPPVEHTDAILGSGADEWIVSDWSEMSGDNGDESGSVLEYLRHDAHNDYDWVWLDSISAWQDVGLDDVYEAAVERKPSRAAFGVDRPEYGINAHRLGLFIRHVVGSGDFHFGITAWPRELPPTEDQTTDEKLMPWIQVKNMPQKICGYMNMVGYMTVKDYKKGAKKGKQYNVIHFKETEDYFAKDQFYAFGDEGKFVLHDMDTAVPTLMEAVDTAREAKLRKDRAAKRKRRSKSKPTTTGSGTKARRRRRAA